MLPLPPTTEKHQGTLRRFGSYSWQCLDCFATGSHPHGTLPLEHYTNEQNALEPDPGYWIPPEPANEAKTVLHDWKIKVEAATDIWIDLSCAASLDEAKLIVRRMIERLQKLVDKA
jgi:hypothetical protein